MDSKETERCSCGMVIPLPQQQAIDSINITAFISIFGYFRIFAYKYGYFILGNKHSFCLRRDGFQGLLMRY
jgi:hypothetical protein